jgi:acyl-coenzyme A synthetase/AMP-(fatty) acid ligase
LEGTIFYHSQDFVITYNDLINKLNQSAYFYNDYFASNYSDFVANVLLSIVNQQDVILIDYRNFHSKENHSPLANAIEILSLDHLIELIRNSVSQIGIYSSGTEGRPKLIYQSITRLNRSVQIDERYNSSRWAFTYNPSHSAGIQVMLQVIFNKATLFDFYKCSRAYILSTIDKYQVNYLSGTPTFYRMLQPFDFILNNLDGITFNGEKSTPELISALKNIAPNARIRNVYGSTESGPLMSSEGDVFVVPNRLLDKIKIANNELLIHHSIMSSSIDSTQEWYSTGDLVEVVETSPLSISFISRKSRVINVGGQNVNPQEIEEVLLNHPDIFEVQVIPRTHPLIENLITAHILKKSIQLTEKDVFDYLKERIAKYKIPRIITFVDEIDIGRTGKKKIN